MNELTSPYTANFYKRSAKGVIVDYLPNSTYKTVQDAINVFNSTGIISGGMITSNGDGSVAITSGVGAIRASDSSLINLKFFDFDAVASLALTNSSINYIYVNYNSGVPNITASTSRSTDFNSKILIGQVYRSGISLSINASVKQVSANIADLTWQSNLAILPFANASGGIISAIGTRNIAISTGSWWNGFVNFITAAFDSSAAGIFTYWYRNGSGGWTSIATQTQINNTQYDNGTGTLATLTGGNYGVAWVFIEVNGNVDVLFGQGDYTLTQASNSDIPGTLPPVISANGRIIGKIIILKSAASFTSIDSAIQNQFQFAQPTDHNSLSDLQGGAAAEYYHLTSLQYTGLSTLTASQLVATNSAGNLVSLAVSTYPSLTEISYVKNVTSAIQTQIDNKQPLDATLTALAALNSTAGYLAQTAADTFAKRTLTGTTDQISISNGDGTTGNPVFSLPQSIASTSSPTFVGLTLSGLTASQLIATDGSKIFISLAYTSLNTASTIVQRDGSGNFAAGTITATLTGNASTATALANVRTIGGVSFDGTANITVSSATAGFTVSGGDLAIGANNLTITGSIGSTGSRSLKGWFTDLQVTNAISGSITGNSATVTNGVYTTDTATVTNTMLAGSITNAKLVNSSITIGSTAISLGASNTTLAGLTSVTSTTFVGTLTGNASTATTAATWTTARTLSISGDLTYTSPSFDGSGNVTAAGTLATVNSNVGSFGSATQASVITVNGKGLITAASNVTITPAVGSITGLGANIATALANSDTTNQASTASAFVQRDANTNATANNFISAATNITAASGTTILTVSSARAILVTASGSATQTIQLPVASTLTVGTKFEVTVTSTSSGAITITSSGANTVTTFLAAQNSTSYTKTVIFTLNTASGTDQTIWTTSDSGVIANSTGTAMAVAFVSPADGVGGIYRQSGLTFTSSSTTLSTTNYVALSKVTSPAFISNTSNVSTVGILRTASGDTIIGIRNNANNANLLITKNTSDVLNWAGAMSLGAVSGTTGSLSLIGTTSGTVTIQPSAAAGTYNFNVPTTSGSSGDILLSGGGGSTAMSWLTPASGVSTFLATPSSANLAAALTDEIGTGSIVFGSVTAASESTVQLGGFIFKIGKKTSVAAGNTTVTFATPFPTQCFQVLVSNSGQSNSVTPGSKTITATNFVIDNSGGSTTDVSWIAVGN